MNRLLLKASGQIKFEDITSWFNISSEELNEETGIIEKKITEATNSILCSPVLSIIDEDGGSSTGLLPCLKTPILNVDDGVGVKAGQILAKMLKESQKTQDITGGSATGW